MARGWRCPMGGWSRPRICCGRPGWWRRASWPTRGWRATRLAVSRSARHCAASAMTGFSPPAIAPPWRGRCCRKPASGRFGRGCRWRRICAGWRWGGCSSTGVRSARRLPSWGSAVGALWRGAAGWCSAAGWRRRGSGGSTGAGWRCTSRCGPWRRMLRCAAAVAAPRSGRKPWPRRWPGWPDRRARIFPSAWPRPTMPPSRCPRRQQGGGAECRSFPRLHR